MAKTNILPHNLEAEQSILGCILIDSALQGELIPSLVEDDFYAESHQIIFRNMMDIYLQTKPVDLVTLCDAISRNGQLENVGGITYITDLAGVVPSTANYEYYLGMVKRDGVLRRLIRSANSIIDEALTSDNSNNSLALAEKMVYDISASQDRRSLVPFSKTMIEVFDNLQKVALDKNALSGLKSGFATLDKFTNGFKKGNLVILAARPSCGKSTFAMNILENIALKENGVCAMFALEMTEEELTMRSLCSISGVNHDDAIKGNLNETAWAKLWQAKKKLDKAKIFIDSTSLTTTAEIMSKCRRLKSQYGLDVIVIDHIQLMGVPKDSGRRNDSRQQEVSEISRQLKMIAKELDVPVLALSQLSRQNTQRKSQRPVLSDLRESGAIEQDADIVIFIHRPDKVAEPEEIAAGKVPKNVAEIIIEKNRSGETGAFELLFKGENAKFVELPPDYKTTQTAMTQAEQRQGANEQDFEPMPTGGDYMDEPPFDAEPPMEDNDANKGEKKPLKDSAEETVNIDDAF